jgi:hypothetical protein
VNQERRGEEVGGGRRRWEEVNQLNQDVSLPFLLVPW